MPLPLLVPIIIAGLGAIGAGKGVKAANDTKKAKNISSNAQGIAHEAHENLEKTKQNLYDSLKSYGEKKLTVIDTHLRTFIDTFGRIKNVEFASGKNDDPSLITITEGKLKEISNTVSGVGEIIFGVSGGIAGLGGGALAAFGAYSGTMLLASAGTGTAISALGGIAASNATLAWLGGGTLAAGGFGIAGGAMVLGILVAGPALLIFGTILGAKAQEKLYDAYSNLEKAKKIEAECSVIAEKLKQMYKAVNLCYSVLDKFSGKMRRANKSLANLIKESGYDYSTYSEDEKQRVFTSVKFAQVLKMIIDLPLLDDDGELIQETVEGIKGLEHIISE